MNDLQSISTKTLIEELHARGYIAIKKETLEPLLETCPQTV